MSQDKEKSLSNIRTFAKDMERERVRRGDAPETKPTEEKGSKSNRETEDTPKIKPAPSTPERKAALKRVAKKPPQKQKVVIENIQVEKETVPDRIPAFHELQKKHKPLEEVQASARDTIAAAAEKITADPKAAANTGSGTIITDTKKAKMPLFPSILSSMQNWIASLKKSVKRKQAPTYSVPDTQRRKGVIQKATSKSGAIFTADSDTLREQIKRRRQESLGTDDESLNWSPYTEPGFALIEDEEHDDVSGSTVKNVVVEYKKQTLPPPVEVAPQQEEPLFDAMETPEPTEAETEPIIETTGEPLAPEAIQLEVEESEGQTADRVETRTTSRRNRSKYSGLYLFDTNTMSISIIAIILGGIAIAFLGHNLLKTYQANQSERTQATVPELATPHLSQSELIAVVLSEQKYQTLLDELPSTILDTNTGVAELYLANTPGTPLPIENTLPIFDLDPAGNMSQLITDVRIGIVDREDRALLLTVIDDASVRGGMLLWEPELYLDVARVLDLDILDTEVTYKFVDQNVDDVDARVLTHNGQTVLIYGFVREGLVVIAGDMEAFRHIIRRQ